MAGHLRSAIAEASLRYDLDVKAALYAAWGVPEFWLADLRPNLLLRYTSARTAPTAPVVGCVVASRSRRVCCHLAWCR
jgi:hypothetical protein